MPKKRFSSQYTKPQSTVHPSLSSSASQDQGSSSSAGKDASPSVNELISSLRSSQISPSQRPPPTVTTPTLPPQIRQLLSLPETPAPAPRPRDRRHYDRRGLRVPGPAPPRSWLEDSRHAPREMRRRKDERVFPIDLNHLPGLAHKLCGVGERHHGRGPTLRDMCLRRIASDWEFMHQYERNNLAYLPATLRMELLSNIAVYGPDDGVGFEGLKHIFMAPSDDEDDSKAISQGQNNDGFFRIDLSGSLGRSISFKQLIELLGKSSQLEEVDAESWEESFTRSLRLPASNLTHLSLSHPAPSVSWTRLLSFSKHVPTLTHLSLAHWPVPSATPNSKTTVMSPGRGRDVQYGGTNYYSHSLDSDFREAASILRRLASSLYSLEYLDLTSCISWLPALSWKDADERGIDWSSEWLKLSVLIVQSDHVLQPESEFWEVSQYVKEVTAQESLRKALILARRSDDGRAGPWIDVKRDDWRANRAFWRTSLDSEDTRKLTLLDTLEVQ